MTNSSLEAILISMMNKTMPLVLGAFFPLLQAHPGALCLPTVALPTLPYTDKHSCLLPCPQIQPTVREGPG